MDLTAGNLFASLLVSTVGFGIFLFGKKQQPSAALGWDRDDGRSLLPRHPLSILTLGGVTAAGVWLAARHRV